MAGIGNAAPAAAVAMAAEPAFTNVDRDIVEERNENSLRRVLVI
jgi:hypothetical protein